MGTYTAHALSLWHKDPHRVSIDTIVFTRGMVFGSGRDASGVFTLRGRYLDVDGSFRWTTNDCATGKKVFYVGTVVAADKGCNHLQGTWELAQKQAHGTFDIKLVPQKKQQQPAMIATSYS